MAAYHPLTGQAEPDQTFVDQMAQRMAHGRMCPGGAHEADKCHTAPAIVLSSAERDRLVSLARRGLEMQARARAQFPRGRLKADDEGQIQIGVTVDQDCVVVAFPSPVTWLGMPAELAEQLAATIQARAREARRNRQ